jgi:GNAT superfamily N-acetyltransferase
MSIRIARNDSEIAACFPVMRELRPHLTESEFIFHIRNLQNSGYQLAFLEQENTIFAVAGLRFIENLANGRFLYVDDLVTAGTHRSQGFGARLLSWLKEYSATNNCAQMHLDCGIQRKDAHRFYEREAMKMVGLHFAYNIQS